MALAGKLQTRTLEPGELRQQEPMSRHVSWRAGGVAARCYRPRDRADLVEFVSWQDPEEALYIVGLGSNLLVRDGGLNATVVLSHGALRDCAVVAEEAQEVTLEVEAGVPCPKVARLAIRLGLEGAEFLAGIPGTVGGALAMNAGCYGAEIWDFVRSVTTLERSGRVRRREPCDYALGYRQVILSDRQQPLGEGIQPGRALEPIADWFLSARLGFQRGDGARAQSRMRELLERRVATQPLNWPNAGSVFRNPSGAFAARLIENCGLKGTREGDAQVSERHANFIINRGQATAGQIETLIRRVQARVWEELGVALQPEVRIVGEELQHA